MKIKSFAAIVDEAKATAHREVEERANAVTVRLLPWWNVVMFALSFFPGMRVHREMIRLELKRILLLRVPAIKAALIEWRIGYEDWEEENRSRGMGSEDSARREQRGKELAKKISAEMLREISDIPDYRFFFLLPKDPSAMVECPYPGFLSTKRAQKYCDELLKAI